MREHTIAAHYPSTESVSLPEQASTLYSTQQKQWGMMHDGVQALRDIQFRTVDCGDFSVRLQYNPKRIISTGAKVDTQSIKERKCFLCVENLPGEQQGVLYRDTFLILCNPMPIFPEHFTVSNVRHIPQSIEESIVSFLDLAKDFSLSHTIFYNGPKCGASAPDHMHFQASPKNLIPVERDAERSEYRRRHAVIGEVEILVLKNYGREVIILESKKHQNLEFTFLRLAGSMRKIFGSADEPMMNVLCSYTDGLWRIIVFPRKKHRPDVYFLDGDKKILISPASVDIGGLVVTPLEKDFLRVDASTITQIFEEVSITETATKKILSLL